MRKFGKPVLTSSLAITTNVGCRNRCSYCPQKSFLQAYKKLSEETRMSFDTFAACITSVPRDICLSFSGFSEPWLNPDCTRMILHAHREGFLIRVNTTLIGMRPEDILQLRGIPFVKFVVHLPDDQNLTHIRVDESYMELLELILKEKPRNLMWKFHRSPGAGIHPLVRPVLDEHRARVVVTGLNSRAGQVDAGSYRTVNRGRVLRACQDFRHNILLPNGDVTLCHMDWSLKHILGNLRTMDYSGLHSSRAYGELLDALSLPDKDILCRTCEKDIVKRSLPVHLMHLLQTKIRGEKNPY